MCFAWKSYSYTTTDSKDLEISLTSPLSLTEVYGVIAQTISSTINVGTSTSSMASHGFATAAAGIVYSITSSSCMLRYSIYKSNGTTYKIFYWGKGN